MPAFGWSLRARHAQAEAGADVGEVSGNVTGAGVLIAGAIIGAALLSGPPRTRSRAGSSAPPAPRSPGPVGFRYRVANALRSSGR